ncbi:MAG: pyridoxal-phosphate dependent enzyme [Acidobacteria bacterium]|nr:MAG: pyridoxal-phosphate dependent enzyme [Acidobacteriota bacterium]
MTATSTRVPLPDRAALDDAWRRVRPRVHRTPVLRSSYFDRQLGAELFFKCENFQKIGAFKIRGAANALFSLGDGELAAGVVTHSSGNHAQAVALAARWRGIRATIVMPQNASAVKVAAVRGYGAEVVLCRPTVEDREATVARLVAERGLRLIHPYDDPRIIAGQATAARELLADAGPLDLLLAPVGGGGLLSGTALTAHHLAPGTRVVGAEPELADDAARSLAAGEIQPARPPRTVCDGLLTSLGEHTFAVIRRHVEAIVTVDEETIVDVMRRVFERMKIVVEPSAVVPLAALVAGRLAVRGRRVGIILSGGNVDLERLPWLG